MRTSSSSGKMCASSSSLTDDLAVNSLTSQSVTRFIPPPTAQRLYSWHPTSSSTPLHHVSSSPSSSHTHAHVQAPNPKTRVGTRTRMRVGGSNLPSDCSAVQSTSSSTATTITTASSSTGTSKSSLPRFPSPDSSTIWFDNFGTTSPSPPTTLPTPVAAASTTTSPAAVVQLRMSPSTTSLPISQHTCAHLAPIHSPPSSPLFPPSHPHPHHSLPIPPLQQQQQQQTFRYSSTHSNHQSSLYHSKHYYPFPRPRAGRSSRSPTKPSSQQKHSSNAPRITSLACFLPR